jgi:FlaA1/EpsC-like NDP-sugar epimerase
MGASKRAMELLLWSHRLPRATTARFANVLFSDGSLPWGFLQRLAKRQPLAGPADVRRYVVSPDEAGALCLLAATVVPHAHVAIPVLDPQRDAVDFASIAQAVVREAGYAPATYTDPDAARAAVAREAAQGRWPVVVTPTDTSGEKAMEVFAAPNETPVACGLDRLRALPAPAVDRTAVADLVAFVADACSGGPMPGKEAITAALARLVPELHHRETGRSLDGKM